MLVFINLSSDWKWRWSCYFYYPFFPPGSSYLSFPLALFTVVALRSFMFDQALRRNGFWLDFELSFGIKEKAKGPRIKTLSLTQYIHTPRTVLTELLTCSPVFQPLDHSSSSHWCENVSVSAEMEIQEASLPTQHLKLSSVLTSTGNSTFLIQQLKTKIFKAFEFQ